jgi:spore maturation protein CgeB
MAVHCVAYMGKFNEPLYFYSKEDISESVHLQMIAHSCLDVVEERKKR